MWTHNDLCVAKKQTGQKYWGIKLNMHSLISYSWDMLTLTDLTNYNMMAMRHAEINELMWKNLYSNQGLGYGYSVGNK